MEHLVTQMLALSRVEAQGVARSTSGNAAVAWPGIVEQAISDCLPLADRRHIEIACEWPPEPTPALALSGDEALLTVLLRNLLDNAVRYASAHTLVTLRFAAQQLSVENDGPALALSTFDRLGERFHRSEGQSESGSGLGISIVRRIAELHRLQLTFGPRADGTGMRVVLAVPGS
jgi:two-component system sensor histidine kinase QseC